MKSYILLLVLFIGAIVCRGQSEEDSIASRLIKQCRHHYIFYDSVPYIENDSTNYTYVGDHGGDINHTIKYTAKIELTCDGPAPYHWQFLNKNVQAFDSNDNISSDNELDTLHRPPPNLDYWRTLYNYDKHNNVLERLKQFRDNSDSTRWFNNEKDIYAYDMHSNEIMRGFLFYRDAKFYEFPNNKWDTVDMYRRVITYNSKGRIVKLIRLRYNSNNVSTGFWDTVGPANYYYDSLGRKSLIIHMNFDGKKNKWIDARYSKFIYDEDGNVVVDSSYEKDSTGIITYNSSSYVYNKFNQPVLKVSHKYGHGTPMEMDKDYYYYETYQLKKKKK